MASVIIHGFKNEESANAFISWFSNQGEPAISFWWEVFSEEKDIGQQPPLINVRETYHKDKKYDGTMNKDEHGNLIAYVTNE